MPDPKQPHDEDSPGEATLLLHRARAGEAEASDRLLALLYDELKGAARACFRRERAGHTLQPTAVVHEAWVRLFQGEQPEYVDHAHFLAVAAGVMRRVLVDHARNRGRDKRGGDWERANVSVSDAMAPPSSLFDADVLDLHRALEELAQLSQRQADIVELRWFGGLTVPEVAVHLDTSERTVERDWQGAKAWLRRRLA